MTKSPLALDLSLFQENLRRLEEQASDLSKGREDQPQILPVTKYLDRADARTLLEHDHGPLGENRADQLKEKTDPGQDPGGWHFIGRLQRNKIREVAPRISLFHSLDSERLAQSLDSWVGEHLSSPLPVLVQINVAGEERKAGLDPVEAQECIEKWVDQFQSLRFHGLMTMAPAWEAEQCRPIFRQLRKIRDQIRQQLPAERGDQFQHLSMGMSGDWQVAVEEGATWIRIGRALYLPPGEVD